MIFMFIFLSCILGSTVGQKEIENDLNYPDASATSKVINPLTRITRDDSDSSNYCILPSGQGIKNYTNVNCVQNCVIQPGVAVETNKVVRVQCDLGYGPASNTQYVEIYVCINGKWFQRKPECVKLCPALKREHLKFECFHGLEEVSCTGFMRPGTIAKFKCDEFYKASYDTKSYSDRTTCMDGGTWSDHLPTCSLVCGLVNQVNKVDATLMFANKTTYGEYPWHIAIYVKKSGRYEYICGGSLISENFILTAAHCMFDPSEDYVKFKESDLKVAAGKGKRDYYIQEQYQVNSDVKNIIIQDTYVGDGTRYAEDIALLETDVSFNFNYFVLPVCLDRFGIVNFEKNTRGTIVGWGQTENGTLSDELQEVRLPIMPIVECRSYFPDFLQFLTSDKYCVIHQNGSGTGMGDSGGGMTFVAYGQHYIRGVVSIKNKDNVFSAFTNVTTYIQWIYNSMRNRLITTTIPTTTTTTFRTTTTPATTTPTTTTLATTTPTTTTPATTTPTTTTPTTTPNSTTTPQVTIAPRTLALTVCENWKNANVCRKNEEDTITFPNANMKEQVAKPGLYTYMAYFLYDRDHLLVSSGALISDSWVLTSADSCCRSDTSINGSTYPDWVILGDTNPYVLASNQQSIWRDPRTQRKRIAEIIIHPDYKQEAVSSDPSEPYPYNINNNLALVKLDSPVVFNEYVAPACLHTAQLIPAGSVVLTGWDKVPDYNRVRPYHLVVAKNPLFRIAQITECIQSKEKARSLTHRVICAYHWICKGNFVGAPLTFTQDGGCTWSLIGITANVWPCSSKHGPAANYTRISAYLPWIKSVVWPNS